MISLRKSKRVLELAIAFWIGVGLMSIINVIKIDYTQHAAPYSWIMFGVSAVFVIVCFIILAVRKK